MVALIDVCKSFGAHRVLDHVSLTLDAPEITALLGASGCGKSTLLRIAAGLLPFDSGQVIASPARMGVVFQDARLLPWLTVHENLTLALPFGVADRRERIESALTSLRLAADTQNRFPRELSGGMAQRVAIARALLREPEVLLMDEPFAALDALTRDEMQGMLVALVAERRLPCLFVTHDVHEAERISERLIVMQCGGLVADFRKQFGHYPCSLANDVRKLLEPTVKP